MTHPGDSGERPEPEPRPDDPNRAFEYPPLENSPRPADPYAPVDYPTTYPPPPPYPPPPGYPPPFPPPYPGYGNDPYDPYRTPRPQGTNGQAIGAFVSSLLGVALCCFFIPSIVGVVLGILAMNETKRTGQEGHGLALSAVVIGGITIVLGVVLLIVALATDTDTSY